MHSWRSLNGPSRRELRLIEAEWPLIAAEIAVVDAEIAMAVTGDEGSELARHRLDQAVTGATELRHLMSAEPLNWLNGGPLGGAA
ncbi:DUF6284 family protein [Kineosporia sp. NBRC 101731]|uniref:DUF6284 family protein n=1 Tax=Kineosporia sp. NBRC 101731 TaxID=3032199 RepID=UPI0024A21F6A|nr:DUF6284 family protein [Kineosporia sp. NBRC 101731]GLY33560.1 hypothetical protein Kisp02_69250 [Kineosporia sp. NBRC 101731]